MTDCGHDTDTVVPFEGDRLCPDCAWDRSRRTVMVPAPGFGEGFVAEIIVRPIGGTQDAIDEAFANRGK